MIEVFSLIDQTGHQRIVVVTVDKDIEVFDIGMENNRAIGQGTLISIEADGFFIDIDLAFVAVDGRDAHRVMVLYTGKLFVGTDDLGKIDITGEILGYSRLQDRRKARGKHYCRR